MRQGIIPLPGFYEFPDFDLAAATTALLIIDMQKVDAHPEHGLAVRAREAGRFEQWSYYFDRLASTVVPNIAALQRHCREVGIEVIHIVLGAFTRDRREVIWHRRQRQLVPPRDSSEFDIIEPLQPRGDEIVIAKTSSGAFNSSPLDQILRNLRIETLIVTGVVTNFCVETTVRDAGDRGFNVVLVDDGCAARNEADHRYALRILEHAYCKVKTTAQVLEQIASPAPQPAQSRT
ncbi:MAG: cysteine hydrolase [Candidatus Tectomicrobia bacterium]|nr:cysteine hydrolase [Candidatus Tectomicrobia bacterium]